MKPVKLGRIALDGTKINANASKHKALSYVHAKKIEKQLKAEVKALTALVEEADQTPVADGLDIPAEIARREARLQALAAAKAAIAAIEVRAQERFEHEQAEYHSKQENRQAPSRFVHLWRQGSDLLDLNSPIMR